MKMKLRNTLGRALPKRRKTSENKKDSSFIVKEDSCLDEPEEDVTFVEIQPFSPLNVAFDTNECKIKNDIDSDISNDSSSDEWVIPDTTRQKRKYKIKKVSDNNRALRKKQTKTYASATDNSERNVELELLIDENKVVEVKSVLSQLPEQFSKEYCKYLHDLQNPNFDKASKKCKPRAAHSKSKTVSLIPICVICENVFESRQEVAEHLKVHLSPEGYICICDKTFTSLKQFSDHINRSHVGRSYECPYCSRSFYGLPHMKVHWKKDHSLSHQYTCTICPKGYRKECEFLEHINVHTGLRPHKCDRCEKEYSSSQMLREHINIHHNKQELKCPDCEKVFVTVKLLNIHRVIHGEVRKYACDKCDKSYKTIQNLREHLSQHGTVRSLQCDDCFKLFLTRNSWRRHCLEYKHGRHADKKADGEISRKTSSISVEEGHESNNAAVKSKSKNVTEKSFKCNDCYKSFQLSNSLRRHCISSKHGRYSEKETDGKENGETVNSVAENGSETNSIAIVSTAEEDSRTAEHDHSDTEIALNSRPLVLEKTKFTFKDVKTDSNDSALELEKSLFIDVDAETDSNDSAMALNKEPLELEKSLFIDVDAETDSDDSEMALNKEPLEFEKPLFIHVDADSDSDENEDKVLTVL